MRSWQWLAAASAWDCGEFAGGRSRRRGRSMNDASETNGASSAATSTPLPARNEKFSESGATAVSAVPEVALLAREAAAAEAAARAKLCDLQSALRRSADLQAWTQERPWWTVGAAAVA